MTTVEKMFKLDRLKKLKISADHNIRRISKDKKVVSSFWESISQKYKKEIDELNQELQ